jgi:hypothetical protein
MVLLTTSDFGLVAWFAVVFGSYLVARGARPDRLRWAAWVLLGLGLVYSFGNAYNNGHLDFLAASSTPNPIPSTPVTIPLAVGSVPVRPMTTTTSATTTTTRPAIRGTEIRNPSDIVLSAAGIGPAELGGPAETVLNALISRFGTPDSDTGWITPTWEGNRMWCFHGVELERAVIWDDYPNFYLHAVFASGGTHIGGPTDRLMYYWYSGNADGGPTTAAGIRPGDSFDLLLKAYPRAENLDSLGGWVMQWSSFDDLNSLRAWLDDDGIIRGIDAGDICSSYE